MRPEPPPHVLLLTRKAEPGAVAVVWLPRGNSLYWNRVGRWSATWGELDAGDHGDVQLLVPVPYAPPVDGQPGALLVQQAVEELLNPAGAMLADLAAAFAAGVTATIAEAYRVGRVDQLVDLQREEPLNDSTTRPPAAPRG